ncbi:hypothetical protein JCM1841_006511 [Sporobolomyces salmonicolor]
MARSPTASKTLNRPHALSSHSLALLSLALRSFALASLVLSSVAVALVAWFSLRSALSVDPLVGRERVWLQYGHFRPPYAEVELPSSKYAAPGNAYDLSLELRVPSSTQNLAVGNFMVSLSLINNVDEALLNVSRPAILTHRSPSGLSAFVPIPLPAVPSAGPQTLHIPLLDSAPFNRNHPRSRSAVQRLFVEVGRRDAHLVDGGTANGIMERTRGGEVQVYESWLRIEAKLSGLRALLRYHPYLSFLFFFPSFLVTELLACLLVYTLYVVRPPSQGVIPAISEGIPVSSIKPEEEEGTEVGLTEGEEEEDIKPLLPTFKTEEEEEEGAESTTTAPTDEETAWRLQKRRELAERAMGPGGVGMSEIAGEEEAEEADIEEGGATETPTEEEEEESEEGWTGAGAAAEDEGGKPDEFDKAATIGGSETTRATRSTFGPSVAGTSSTATRTTATSASTSAAGLRGRGGDRTGEETE